MFEWWHKIRYIRRMLLACFIIFIFINNKFVLKKCDLGGDDYDSVFGNQEFNGIDNVVNVIACKDIRASDCTAGTGTIIHNSANFHTLNAGINTDHNQILTAYHIIHDAKIIRIYDDEGVYLGLAAPVINTKKDVMEKVKKQDETFAEQDCVFLGMTESEKDYDFHDGLSISLNRSRHMFHLYVSNPFGVEHGASGSPVLDSNGNIIGVVSGTGLDIWKLFHFQIQVTAHNMAWFIKDIRGNKDKNNHFVMRSGNTVLIAPIPGNSKDEEYHGSITIPGYTNFSGVIYHAFM